MPPTLWPSPPGQLQRVVGRHARLDPEVEKRSAPTVDLKNPVSNNGG